MSESDNKLDTYIEEFNKKSFKHFFTNPLIRIKLTHIVASNLLFISALFFTQELLPQIIQIVLGVVIIFHDIDDKYLKIALSKKIHELENTQDLLEEKVEESQKANIKTIKELQEQKKAIDEHAIVGVTDTAGNIIYVNDKFCEISQYSREELMGKNHRIVNSGYHDRAFWKRMYQHVQSGNTWRAEVCNVSKDGFIYWVDTTIVPIFDAEGKIKSYASIRTDVTNFKLVEEELIEAKERAEQSVKVKEEFLASMSHEIRTPLNAILGFVSQLQKEPQSEKAKGYLDIIDSSGKSLLSVINDILDFSKLQSGKFKIEMTEVNVVEEFSRAVVLFNSKAFEKDIVYTVFIDPQMPKSMKMDFLRVKQILFNLLSNAVKFTPRYGHINVAITYSEGALVLSVKDSGIGISKEKQVEIFSAFTQADNSTTRKYGGTGLGLSISQSLAHLMSGELRVESSENSGAIFSLTLPVEVVEATPDTLIDKEYFAKLKVAFLNNHTECNESMQVVKLYLQDFGVQELVTLEEYQSSGYDLLFFAPDDSYNDAIIEAKIPAVALLRSDNVKMAEITHIAPLYAPFVPLSIVEAINETGIGNIKSEVVVEESEEEVEFEGHILVVEDNKTNQMLIKLLLMDYGLTFKLANDGVEAVEIFQKEKFDLVLMDENMPNKNGLEAMREIREYEKENTLQFTPIVALTANALESDKKRFLEAGMDGFIAKPIDNKLLELELAKFLKRVA